MVKKHLKRLNAPKGWSILRKNFKFIMRPNSGPHSLTSSLPLGVLIRDMICYAKTSKEIKYMLNNRGVLVDGVKRTDPKFPIGLFDCVEFSEANKCFRIVFDSKGNLSIIPADKAESKIKPCKIDGKSKVKGKTQLNLFDGANIITEKDDFKVGDTLLLELPKRTIKEHIKFQKGVTICLVGGKHTGQIGKIVDVKEDKISYKNKEGEVVETLKKYAFVVGTDKPAISLIKK